MNLNSALSGQLQRAIDLNRFPIEITGSVNPAVLAWTTLGLRSLNRPVMIVCPDLDVAKELLGDFRAFGENEPTLLTGFDETPYSGLTPAASDLISRAEFLFKARKGGFQIFVAPIEAVLQKTANPENFQSLNLTVATGDLLGPDQISEHLSLLGYSSSPMVEDVGAFSRRGDIIDVFPPLNLNPIRIEFFGDTVESVRSFETSSQRTLQKLESVTIIGARELTLSTSGFENAYQRIKAYCDERGIGKAQRDTLLEPLKNKILFDGLDYWLSLIQEDSTPVLSAFAQEPIILWLDVQGITQRADNFIEEARTSFKKLISSQTPVPDPELVYSSLEKLRYHHTKNSIDLVNLKLDQGVATEGLVLNSKSLSEFSQSVKALRESQKDYFQEVTDKISHWLKNDQRVLIFTGTKTQADRLRSLFDHRGIPATMAKTFDGAFNSQQVYLFDSPLSDSFRLPDDGIVFLRDEDIFGERTHREKPKGLPKLSEKAQAALFSDLSPGDLVIHLAHGAGVYEGLKVLSLQGADAEYIQIRYKDNDRLYLPIYRVAQIQKYSGPSGSILIDKLGGTSWAKTKIKVRNALQDIASELLELYAKRASLPAHSFGLPGDYYRSFEATFPYDETVDQAKAIEDVLEDLHKGRPMDRLICGDVGFGKTEVAIRAAFQVVHGGKQVAVLVPTTVLAFQHYQTFKKRFKDFPISVELVSRFSSAQEIKKALAGAAEGKVDVLIGTHRLLSKDVAFKDIGLLVIDEEHRFGVTHKERLRKFRSQVHTLSMTATPIPRTLNMSLMGVRDLTVISTPPEERLSIRTFVSRFDKETIRRAIENEVKRGGQVFFLHNRVESINAFAEELRSYMPGIRIMVGHGQMPDEQLEKAMLAFNNHECDVLLCTTIIESGLDIPNANTILIDRADTFGLAQLYQLRGRVGRAKRRAYCYLLVPSEGALDKTAQERLRVIQKHTELGSGFQIAHHDLELRGSGNILGEDQSGHIAAVGYELYMELLEEALSEAKGEPMAHAVEPDINIRIPALIPDSYIPDIRLRLSFYKVLSDIKNEEDIASVERDLQDRFGPIPEQVSNLFGMMLIRKTCKDLGVKDITSGPKNLSLLFDSSTTVKPEAVIKLATTQSTKYQLTPENKLLIKMANPSWATVLEELRGLSRLFLQKS